ncbi:hypothetical protein KPL70_012686 [Citrus sinensis]|uniref:protein GOLVEN 6 isoform X2 n=1 Tax=Citrus sinensis TaxID=2711 RepID=UPI0021989F9F|nr:protein GOLVEN 6 isoform X2 [Citrus sinensis]KAH9707834.1 hypothetical protein KPL70_012686 [Citrus sinensis]
MQNIHHLRKLKVIMELMRVITSVLCISLYLSQTPFASLEIQLQPTHDVQAKEVQLSRLTLPRKLRVLTAEVKGLEAQVKMTHKEDVSAGNTNRLNNKYKNNKEQGVKPGGGTRQEWVEGGDTSQYFTMDYSHVKRRRPIHNKSLPAAAP